MHRNARGLGQVRVPIILANQLNHSGNNVFRRIVRAIRNGHKPDNRFIIQQDSESGKHYSRARVAHIGDIADSGTTLT